MDEIWLKSRDYDWSKSVGNKFKFKSEPLLRRIYKNIIKNKPIELQSEHGRKNGRYSRQNYEMLHKEIRKWSWNYPKIDVRKQTNLIL